MVSRIASLQEYGFEQSGAHAIPVLVLTEQGVVRYISPGGRHWLGGDGDHAVGRAFAELFLDPMPGHWSEQPSRFRWRNLADEEIDVEVRLVHFGPQSQIFEARPTGPLPLMQGAVAAARAQLRRHAAGVRPGQVEEGLIGVSREGRILSVNRTAMALTGWSEAELIGADVADMLMRQPNAPEAGSLFDALREDLRKERRGGATELFMWRSDGGSFPAALALVPLDGDDDAVPDALLLFLDLSAAKHTEERLRLASAVFDNAAEGIAVLDANFRVTTVNPAFTAVTGFALAEVQGSQPFFLSAALSEGGAIDEIWNGIRRTGRWETELWSARKDGGDYAVWLSISATTDEVGNFNQYVAVFSDVTQRKRDEERIRYQATYDTLTGLPNRSLFMDRLALALRHAERNGHRVGLMFIDLDGFKLINDTLGHDVGDELLKEVAQRLLLCVRQGDTVTRFGGDEFTIIMPDLGELRNVLVVAHRIIDTLKLPFLLKGSEAYISASIGITSYPDDAHTVQALLKNADAAMYRAKETGKANFQFYTAGLEGESSSRLAIKNGLSKALERQELQVLYQPKCDVATGRLTGAEALLRWNSAELGLMLPATFIPVLEETGLIDQVGDWVLESACHQHKLWREAGFGHMRVAVNLSVRQLRQGNLVKTVENLLSRYAIEPSGLELEITESMIMKDTEHAVGVLKHLSGMGVHLTMDDFGTGYSSLSYLKRFPQNTIKIDRSFVNDIATDPDDLEIIRTIINMGHSLRRRVVAEGVETEAQRQLLHQLRCDEMQGFLLSPPVPPSDIDRMLASTKHGCEV